MTKPASGAILLACVAAAAVAAAPNRHGLPAARESGGDQPTAANSASGDSKLVHVGPGGKLVYQPYDTQGDQIADFSNCGYGGGGVKIPTVPVKLTLKSQAGGGDDTSRLQRAIEQVSAMPLDADGFRGALLLSRGEYRIGGVLHIRAGGVVLRGEGDGADGTILRATGTEPRSLIEVQGSGGPVSARAPVHKVLDSYVPVGAHSINVEGGSALRVGDTIFVRRIGNAAWIHELKMDQLITRPGTRQWPAFDMEADRVITAISGNRITIDAPLTCSIDQRWGGGEVLKYSDPGRIEHCGVENLRADSSFNPAVKATLDGKPYDADENHARDAIAFDDCKNCWARKIIATHFINGVAKMERSSKWVTVEDCEAREPVSIITGGRRYPFNFMGQLSLVQRCLSDEERHAFVVNGTHLFGPDVFLNCKSEHDHADSGPHQRWSTGTLFDNVSGTMRSQDRQDMGSGHGWAGANDVYWNCSGTIVIQQPPTAQNFAIGFVGKVERPSFPQLHHPIGYYECFGHHVKPESLYLQQLKDRLGAEAVANISEGGASNVNH